MHSLFATTPIRAHRAACALLICALLVTSGLFGGCKGKKHEQQRKPQPAPKNLAGLDAMPRGVTAVIGFDAVELQRSWLVRRAVAQMFARDRDLEGRIDALISSCEIDLDGGISAIIIGLGQRSGTTRGTEEAVMVVTGTFVEAKLASCIGQRVASDGRTLVADKVDGRTLYGVVGAVGRPLASDETPADAGPADANANGPAKPAQPRAAGDEIWFGVAGSQTLVVATSKAWLIAAVGDGDKVMSEPVMAALIERADRSAAIWAAGQMSPEVGVGLVTSANGAIAAPPRAIVGSVHLRTGVKVAIGVEMTSPGDANVLKSQLQSQMGLIALAAQTYGLGAWLGKLGVDVEQETVYLRLALDDAEVRQILSRIDTPAESAQNPADNRGDP